MACPSRDEPCPLAPFCIIHKCSLLSIRLEHDRPFSAKPAAGSKALFKVVSTRIAGIPLEIIPWNHKGTKIAFPQSYTTGQVPPDRNNQTNEARMKCPKCGYERQHKDNLYVPATECPACGIVYAKSESSPSQSPGNMRSMLSKPSPVDPQSLKKARERVELRLRRQWRAQQKDERHALTLERAKRIAALELKGAGRGRAWNTTKSKNTSTLKPRMPM